MWGSRVRTVVVAAATISLLVANAAWADNIGTSDDGLNTVSSIAFGETCLDETATQGINAHAIRQGSGNVYPAASTVTVSATAASGGLTVTGGTFTIPADWEDGSQAQQNGNRSDRHRSDGTDRPEGRTAVEVSLTPTATGSYSGSFTLSGVGVGTTRTTTVSASATVVDCAPPDETAPEVSISLHPDDADGDNGWYVSPVTVTVSAVDEDGGSGVDEGSVEYSFDGGSTWSDYSAPFTVSADGTYTVEARASDNAGNEGTAGPVGFQIDATVPTITGSRAPEPNVHGWNNGPVTVSFDCADATSGIASCVGGQTLSDEGAGQSVIGTATDVAGNTDTDTVSGIDIDLTPPIVGFTITPEANAAGWHNSAVTVTFECADTLSGLDADLTDCDPVTLESDGVGQSASATAVDLAGNATTIAVEDIHVDTSSPTITGAVSPAANANGWHAGAVQVSFTCTDDGPSGIDGCVGDITMTGEGENQQVTGTATDVAGNTATVTVTVHIDLTPPTITPSRTPEANEHRWNNEDVTVSFDCADALSGIDDDASSCDEVVVSAEGVHAVTGTAVDLAGNSTSATVSGIRIDKTRPVTNVTGFTDQQVLHLGDPLPDAGCASTDDRSGIDQNATPHVDDSALIATGVGKVTVTCSGATDKAGNEALDATAIYWIQYAFDGFYKPIDSQNLNSVKAGQAVPVKFSLDGDHGLDILASSSPSSIQRGCDDSEIPTEIDESTGTPGSSSLTYDATTDTYNYVWKTDKKWAGTCRTLIVALHDGSFHTARFEFKR